MHIYGHCPAHDDFYLVVCSQCGQVVKPQAFERHCERLHGSVTKICNPPSTLAPQQLNCSSLGLSNNSSSMERKKEGRCQKGGTSSATSPAQQHKSTKTHKYIVRYCLRVPVQELVVNAKINWLIVIGELFPALPGDVGKNTFTSSSLYLA